MADRTGAALGEAACHAQDAYLALARAVVRLDLAGIEFDEDGADIVDAVGDIADFLRELADEYAHAEVRRGAA